MRKYYISLFAASILATAAFAQSPKAKIKGYDPGVKISRVATYEELRPSGVQGADFSVNLEQGKSNSAMRLRHATADDAPITETPAGELTSNAYGGAHGYYPLWSYIENTTTDGNVIEIVESENNLYIKNPLSLFLTRTWMKGEKKAATKAGEPDSVLVQLPQAIMKTTVKGFYGQDSIAVLYLKNIAVDEEGKRYFSKNQIAKYTWDGDTLKSAGKDMLSLVDADDNWYGYGDDSLTVFKLNDTPTALPSAAVKGKYVWKYTKNPDTENTVIINRATDGDDYYVGDMVDKQDFWVKGIKEGDKVVFKKQYLGIDTTNLSHTYFIPEKARFEYDQDLELWIARITEIDRLEYALDEKGGLTTDSAFNINLGKIRVSASNLFANSSFSVWEDKPYTPQTPVIGMIDPYDPDYEFGDFQFDLPTEDADGTLLDVNRLYYVVYIGNEGDPDLRPYTFTADKYYSLEADMDTIPATFKNSYDFLISGITHQINIYDPIFSGTNLGVKAIYKGGNMTTESATSWAQVEAGVKGVTTGSGTPKSVVYHDLSGRRVTNPSNGLYIKTVRYADGTVKSMKVMR